MDEPAQGTARRTARAAPSRLWKTVGLTAAALAALVAVAVAALSAGAGGRPVRAILQAKLGRTVDYRKLSIAGAKEGLRLVFTDLRVGQPSSFGPGDLLRAPRAELVVRVAPLLAGRLEAPSVALTSPELHLRRRGHGDSNWTFGKGGASGPLGATRSLAITGGRVTMDDPQRRLTLQGVFSHDGAGGALPLHLEGGGVLQGEPYRVRARGGPLNGRRPHSPHSVAIEMQDGATHLVLTGSTQAPFDLGGLDMDVQAEGPNLADLVYLFNLPTPNSPPFRLHGHMRRQDKRFALTRLDARLGDSDLEGEVRSERLERRRITAVLRSRRMTAADLRVLLASPPPHGEARSRPGVAGPGGGTPDGRLFSTTPVSLRRLGGSDVTLDYRAEAASGFGPPLSGLALKLSAEHGRLAVAPLSFGVAGGSVRVDYALDTSVRAFPAHLSARVSGVHLARVGGGRGAGGRLDAEVEVRGAGPSVASQAATAGGRARLRLTAGALPRLQAAALSGDVFGLLGAALSPKGAAPLRCVAADFTIAAGVARATRLVVATGGGAATGGGEVDLRDERLHLRLEASAQGRRPLLQLRTPIRVEGTLTKPHTAASAPALASGASDLVHALGRLVGVRPVATAPAPLPC